MDNTVPVREGFGLDLERLQRFMQDHVAGFSGPLSARQFSGGQSNPTYLLRSPGRNYVLRRKPPGELLASAHAVDREYRVIKALGDHTGVPVAKAYALCTDPAVIGSWFYLMEAIEGRVFWDPTLPELETAQRPGVYEAMIDALARLHRVDFQAVGLGDYGKPGSYFLRQIGRWSKQYTQDDAAGRSAAMDRLIEWLPANIPAGDEASVVHGDYRCDNLIFHPVEARVLAIIDWELSTIGHPLADLGYQLMIYRVGQCGISGLLGRDLRALGIPDESAYVSSYCRHTGRAGIGRLDFYIAFNMFRMAAIFHGIRGRMLRGTASSARAKEYAAAFDPMADAAWRQAERAMAV
jgi:aminoglycoside phosphotransferase (APT) family kinase protein